MTPLDALTRILFLSQSLDRTFTANPGAKLPQIATGQQVSAKVEALLPNGNFRVSIENQPLQMSLPQGTKPGNTVNLVLVGREPRLTFRLDLPQNTSSLSDTGRMIAQLLPDASQPNPPLTQANPILPSILADPKQLAQSLQSTLAHSGLFYESHQAQWVAGERPLAQLLQEPQNQPAPPPGAAAQNMDTMRPPVQEAALPNQGLQYTTLLQTGATPTPSESRSNASPSSEATPNKDSHAVNQASIKPEILPIVRQQIETLETREFNWSGQIWPGQNMDWQVQEDEHGHGSELPDSWQSRLRLTLPGLGEVDANLKLTRSGVQISLQAAKQETGSMLRENGKMLLESLKAGGITITSMAVKQHG
jgi:hypothetical protein